MYKLFLFVLTLQAWELLEVESHSKYVPNTPEVCDRMMPHHKHEPQVDESPYKVILYTRKVHPGKTIPISLVVDEEKSYRPCLHKHSRCYHRQKKGFKGFYIQARDTRENRPIGKFLPTEDHSVKVHNCGSGTDNAAFHGVKGRKTNVTLEWTAPEDFQGKILFTASFVKKFHTFWIHVKSLPISIRYPYRRVYWE